MGDYADWGDVAGRYPTIDGAVDAEEAQDSFISGVEAVMNGYLANQFTTPVSGKPPLLEHIAIDLSYAKIAIGKDKHAQKIKDDAMALLEKICEGKVLLTDTDGEQVAQNGQAVWSTENEGGYHPTHSDLGPLYDHQDDDRLQDLANERN